MCTSVGLKVQTCLPYGDSTVLCVWGGVGCELVSGEQVLASAVVWSNVHCIPLSGVQMYPAPKRKRGARNRTVVSEGLF